MAKNLRVRIVRDSVPENPREEWDNLGTIWLPDHPATEVKTPPVTMECRICHKDEDGCECVDMKDYASCGGLCWIPAFAARALARTGLETLDAPESEEAPRGYVQDHQLVASATLLPTWCASQQELDALPVYEFDEDRLRKVIDREEAAVALEIQTWGRYAEELRTGDPVGELESDHAGCIYIGSNDLKESFGGNEERARAYLEAEVKEYNRWARGDVWGFEVIDEEGNVEDSCFGFYGDTLEETGIQEHLEDALHPHAEQAWENREDPSWEPDWEVQEPELQAAA